MELDTFSSLHLDEPSSDKIFQKEGSLSATIMWIIAKSCAILGLEANGLNIYIVPWIFIFTSKSLRNTCYFFSYG